MCPVKGQRPERRGMDQDPCSTQRVIAALTQSSPARPEASSLPDQTGVYAWWVQRARLADAMPPIPQVWCELRHDWSLLYVGIVPRREDSSDGRTIAERVGGEHRCGNIGASTFRQSLGALLRGKLGLQPQPGHGRPRFLDEGPLTEWIGAHCGMTWVCCSRPWDVETGVIEQLCSPLNIQPGFHEYRFKVKKARKELRHACGL